jgi:hypothetical protein
MQLLEHVTGSEWRRQPASSSSGMDACGTVALASTPFSM